jgi:hypothetical protein
MHHPWCTRCTTLVYVMHGVVHEMHYPVLLMHYLITGRWLETQQYVPIRLRVTGVVHARFSANQATGLQLGDGGNDFPAWELEPLGDRLKGRMTALAHLVGEAGQDDVDRNAVGSDDRTILIDEGVVGPKPPGMALGPDAAGCLLISHGHAFPAVGSRATAVCYT